INVTAVITFIAETYSFPILAELILFPFLFIVSAMQIMSEKKKEHIAVYKLMTGILVIVGIIYVGYGVSKAATDFNQFVTWNNLREFSIPIFLSLLFLPYLYFLSVVISYELILNRLRWAQNDV